MTPPTKATGRAAAFFAGPAEFLDFVLPIYAGAGLGAGGAQIGALTALELLVSLLFRPLAGRWADAEAGRGNQRLVAIVGCLLYAASFVIYAWTPTVGIAYVAAAVGGAGGAFFWVALRALVATRGETNRFAALMEDESTGGWVAFVVGLPLMATAGHVVTFLVGAASCLAAAAFFASVPRVPHPRIARGRLPGELRPILILVALVALGESVVALLLILHLSQGLGLSVSEVALVYLPGAIVLSIAPRPLHHLMRARAPRWVAAAGLACSAAFAAAMAWRPEAWQLAALWVLMALCWSLLIPLLERLVAEVAPAMPGRAYGRYQAAELAGAAAGAGLAGLLFGAGAWLAATLGAAGVLIAAAAYGVRLLAPYRPAAPQQPKPPHQPQPPQPPTPMRRQTKEKTMETKRNRIVGIAIHTAIFVVAQAIFAATADSWPLAVVQGRAELGSLLGWSVGEGWSKALSNASRIWTIVWLIDAAWTAYRLAVPARKDGE